MKTIAVIISCEHAVNSVPETYQPLFKPYQDLLQTHRAIDFGALAIATYLSKQFHCHFIQANTTRLLIDCNRSLSHRQCFSEITAPLSQEEKNRLIEQFYLPFRQAVETNIKKYIQQGNLVLHLSIHSFTPELNGSKRNGDVGFLYDPKRSTEKKLTAHWQKELKQVDTHKLRIRLNYPYRGISDGFTTALRKQFFDEDYAGIEIETNQALVEDVKFMDYFSNLLAQTLKKTLSRLSAN